MTQGISKKNYIIKLKMSSFHHTKSVSVFDILLRTWLRRPEILFAVKVL